MNRFMALSAVCLVLSGAAAADTPTAKHALLGTWAVNVDEIQQPNPPRSVTLTLTEAGGGSYRLAVVIEASDGTRSAAEGTFRPDGSVNRVTGSLDVDMNSLTMPTNRVLIMGGAYDGRPASTRVWTLSDDGKQMIEVAIRHLPDGTPYQRTVRWTRQ